MGIFRSAAVISAAAPLTLEERYNSASAEHGSALSVFEDLASRLSHAALEYQAVADEAQSEIMRLGRIADQAYADMQKATDSAVSILDITRGFRND